MTSESNAPQVRPDPEPMPSPAQVPRGRLRVLHADGNALDSRRCRQELEQAGWQVQIVQAASRDEFSSRIWSGVYDIALVDAQLEGWRGMDVVEALRRLRRDIPVVMVAGSIGEESVAESLRGGIADYVFKGRLGRLPLVIDRVLRERADRTEKRRLTEERDRFFMLSSDLLCILDTRGGILQLNPAWQRTLGFEIEELVKQPLVEWLHPEDRPKLSNAIEALAHGSCSIELETRFLASDGNCRWLQWRASCLPRQPLIYASVRDVTETKILQAQLLRTQRVESIGTLANGIAHDLNNVLTPILMAVDLLQERTTEPRQLKLLNTVQRAASHGADMVKRIMIYSKGMDGDQLPIQLRHLVHQMRDFARDTFPPSIEVRTDVAMDPWEIIGDATQLHQVLLNLCVNARDAMPGGGVLTLELANHELDEAYSRLHVDARPGRYTLLRVADTGSGIPPDLMEKIFEPFFTTKEPGKGTGLGLSTVLGIVKGHGGFLNVYSEPGAGTRFNLYFPSLAREESAGSGEPQGAVMQAGQGEFVLVVDDDESFRHITRSILEKYNYRVTLASNGEEGLRQLELHRGAIELVIADMVMPGMDGLSMLREIRRQDARVKLMATSGMTVQEPCRLEPRGEVVPFLLKPYDTPRLLDRVRSVLHDGAQSKIVAP